MIDKLLVDDPPVEEQKEPEPVVIKKSHRKARVVTTISALAVSGVAAGIYLLYRQKR